MSERRQRAPIGESGLPVYRFSSGHSRQRFDWDVARDLFDALCPREHRAVQARVRDRRWKAAELRAFLFENRAFKMPLSREAQTAAALLAACIYSTEFQKEAFGSK